MFTRALNVESLLAEIGQQIMKIAFCIVLKISTKAAGAGRDALPRVKRHPST
jgi:hypothetical protein